MIAGLDRVASAEPQPDDKKAPNSGSSVGRFGREPEGDSKDQTEKLMNAAIDGTVIAAIPVATRTQGWLAQAVALYERSSPARRAALRGELASRLLELTGTLLQPEDLYADPEGRLAVANVDGASFRLYRHGGLVLVRPCAYCGTGHLESLEITDSLDLGYALSAWCPLHEDCEDYAAEDLAEF